MGNAFSYSLPEIIHQVIPSMILPIYELLTCRGADTLIAQAREWESSGEHARAVDCYIKVTNKVTVDASVLEKCWVKVSECTHV